MRPESRSKPGFLLVLISVLAGCASVPREQSTRGMLALPAASELEASAAIVATLELRQKLIQGGPAEQAETLALARRAFEASPHGASKLRYALALATPLHPARDLPQAQRLLRELLAEPEILLPLERSLALIELQTVDIELRLLTEKERLLADAQRERGRDRGTAANAALNKRLQAEIDENARLRKELDDARAKLEAIATIEQDITERKPTIEGRRP